MSEKSGFTGMGEDGGEESDFSDFKFTLGIIGGCGSMGRWFRNFYSDAGVNVIVSDIGTELTNKDLAKQSDVVFLSVPMNALPAVCREVAPLLSESQLLMDCGSLKTEVMKNMLDYSRSEVLGTHPLFGPFSDSIHGQNVIFCNGRGEKWHPIFRRMFENKGARVTYLEPDIHDRNMAVFQGLTHFLNIAMGRTLQKIGMPLEHVKHSSTPVFRVSLDLVGRLFKQDPDLYAQIIGTNPFVLSVIDAFLASFSEAKEKLLNGDDSKSFMNEIKAYLGDYCDSGFKESNAFLNALYKDNEP